MFKICMIGCGAMAKTGHAPSVKKYAAETSDTVLAACCDVDIKKAQLFKEEFGFVHAYTDYQEMLAEEKPDVVLILVSVKLTAKIAVDVMNQGYSVIMEKPPGMNIQEAKKIHECAVRNNVHARVAFNRRYMPLIQALVDEIRACGKMIHHADCHFIRCTRTESDFCTTAIHGIDTMKYIIGSDYKKATFTYQDYVYQESQICNYYIAAEFENSATANINFIRCGGCVVERIHVSAEDYTFFVELPVWGGMDIPGKITCSYMGNVYKTIIGDKDAMYECSGFYDENVTFFEKLRSGAVPFSDVATGIQSVEIADLLRNRVKEYVKE